MDEQHNIDLGLGPSTNGLPQTPYQEFKEELEERFEEFLNKKYAPCPTQGSRKIKSPKEFAQKTIKYFLKCYKTGKIPFLKGYTQQALGMSHVNFYKILNDENYMTTDGKDYQEIAEITKNLFEESYFQELFKGNTNAARFVLQTNYDNYIPKEKVINENHNIEVHIGSKNKKE